MSATPSKPSVGSFRRSVTGSHLGKDAVSLTVEQSCTHSPSFSSLLYHLLRRLDFAQIHELFERSTVLFYLFFLFPLFQLPFSIPSTFSSLARKAPGVGARV